MKVYLTSILMACLLVGVARSETVSVTVTIRNLAQANSISFAPLRLGFHNGTFDAFNNGQVATAPIISVAEGGSGECGTAFATGTRCRMGCARSHSRCSEPLAGAFLRCRRRLHEWP